MSSGFHLATRPRARTHKRTKRNETKRLDSPPNFRYWCGVKVNGISRVPSCNLVAQKLYSFSRFSFFVLDAFFENVFSPKGWQKNSQNCLIPKCSDLIDFPMVLPIFICKFDTKDIPDAFKHVPDLFWRLRDWKTRTNTQNLKQIKLAPKKQLGVCSMGLNGLQLFCKCCRSFEMAKQWSYSCLQW